MGWGKLPSVRPTTQPYRKGGTPISWSREKSKNRSCHVGGLQKGYRGKRVTPRLAFQDSPKRGEEKGSDGRQENVEPSSRKNLCERVEFSVQRLYYLLIGRDLGEGANKKGGTSIIRRLRKDQTKG